MMMTMMMLMMMQARPATYIIQAIDELKDMSTLATLLAVPNACDTFWRESHSRREDIRRPARSILARAFGHSLCRKRLRIVEPRQVQVKVGNLHLEGFVGAPSYAQTLLGG